MTSGFLDPTFLDIWVTKVFCGEMSCPLRVLICLVAPWLLHSPRMSDNMPAVVWEVQLPSS